MAVAQLNARIDAEVKRGGDATLARLGVSATEAIRALWTYLAEAQTLPEFMRKQEESPSDGEQPVSLPADGAGLAWTMARDRGLVVTPESVDYDELRDLAFDELVAEGICRV